MGCPKGGLTWNKDLPTNAPRVALVPRQGRGVGVRQAAGSGEDSPPSMLGPRPFPPRPGLQDMGTFPARLEVRMNDPAKEHHPPSP